MLDSVLFVTSTDGTQICTYSAGDASKPAVVFIPGYCCTSLVFTKQFGDPELGKALHLIAYDVRGQGRSGSPANAADYVSARHAEDFKAVCDAYSLDKPFICGWSLGGIIPADVATAYGADFIRGVIWIAALPYQTMFPAVAHPRVFELGPSFASTDVAVFYKACVEFVESLTASPLPYDVKLAWIGGVASMDPAARTHVIGRTQDERALVAARDTLPMMMISGEHDLNQKCENMRAFMAAHFPKARFVRMEGVGHAPFYERPADVNREIARWVGQVLEPETA